MYVDNYSAVGLLLRKLDRLIDDRFDRTLGVRAITRRDWQLLNTLAERSAALRTLDDAVAPFLDRERGESVGERLASLQARDLIRTAAGRYELTPSGRELVATLTNDVQAIRQLTVQGLTDGEYERTIDSLLTMIHNLEGDSDSVLTGQSSDTLTT